MSPSSMDVVDAEVWEDLLSQDGPDDSLARFEI
jgi:hypothetical protein